MNLCKLFLWHNIPILSFLELLLLAGKVSKSFWNLFVKVLEKLPESAEISGSLFCKLGIIYSAFFETVLTGKTTRLELSGDILFASKFVVYCPE